MVPGELLEESGTLPIAIEKSLILSILAIELRTMLDASLTNVFRQVGQSSSYSVVNASK